MYEWPNRLQGIKVARNQTYFDILLGCLMRQRRHNIICLVIIQFIERPAKRLEQFVQYRDLRVKIGWCWLAPRLIVWVNF